MKPCNPRPGGGAQAPARFPPLRAIIFDMDGTLYQSPGLDRQYERSLYAALAANRNISFNQARVEFQARHEALARWTGVRFSKLCTLNTLGVPDRAWAQRQGRRVNPAAFLKPDPALRQLLLRLAVHFKLAVVTNNHRENTEATLARLNILDCFDDIMTLSESRCYKPSPDLYLGAAQRLKVAPAECLSVGDRYHLDLEPAAAVGMQTLMVQRRRDLFQLAGCLVRAQAARLRPVGSRALARAARQSVRVLRAGQLAILPTDTVYGLAAMPDPAALRWIYRAKGRAPENPLVLLLSDSGEAEKYAAVSPRARSLMQRHWPGGLTLVLPARPGTPWAGITRGGRQVALRVPDHAWMRQVIRGCGGALAVTSANRSGEPAPMAANALDSALLAFAHLVVDLGACPVKIPSTVARVAGSRIQVLRQGAVQVV